MATREKPKGERALAGAARRLRHDAETDREYTTPERARRADAGQPLEPPPEGKDPPARRGEDDRGRPIGR